MVSLWPWKDDTSAAGFEKTLSTLATKIAKTGSTNESLRQRSRKVRVVWTLWAGFAYILVFVVLTFITGWQNWGPVEGTALASGLPIIWLVRMALNSYYDYRIANTQAHLDHLYKERDATIEKLKAATKYNSTQQLLEKYGSPQPSPVKTPASQGKRRTSGNNPQNQQKPPQQQMLPPQARTNMAPPPTANIQRRLPPSPDPTTPSPQTPQPPPSLHTPNRLPHGPTADEPSESFAPNAFGPAATAAPAQQQYAPGPAPSHWWDRLVDAMIGEDETLARNRFALICAHCRLVNGQAPPGIKTIEEVGQWRCQGCREWNGVESEARKLVKEFGGERMGAAERLREDGEGVKENREMVEVLKGQEMSDDDGEDDIGRKAAGGDGSDGAVDEDEPPAGSTRSKTRGRSKEK
ncbi:hypothetical protein K490DRAFT_43494 [Saccharata proteae CBS 121410]|uniref:Endoplasmic reticulum junction formation protein lunapark n=1 Tax=Saccharata proteae CBS 121410 TaxID=1314787 RepID=A0A9P4HWT6_9PEZI|nr:hypothetical protein K490DRAFT_43494 [Saccharata proteae CBS 121410]